ncbi:diacylglycerol kinase family protein [Loigolactobacillus coryniformis]|jgi:undecaprenol kinase|uniref:Diacylglycerol kinase n=4 Tax=Loigolactobacillus coryniformis TaxID=1610 RepID=J3ESA2_9LACO|nr:diacylglycerol kinase family protein [Loigolactobacillus coryniformis]MDT3392554.1 diacylglycerol kinase family protein [Bacillota bacterium]OEH90235.1 UDP kinase [Loigolactobacillus coryniformis subsp. coryniformis]RRG07194.1 MAG: diacylglycerol kinase family protein [Lactobacillus sp.]ATO43764.1 UDP kinase [Loigolactobacillus coryniformis subsp. torquens DSM 20004 = KCTC 3535]ATO55446.1 UDP kinase [Loigolactobacillus coryniformis subsp. coryniformis KCTC 3167 = DSM 20001]
MGLKDKQTTKNHNLGQSMRHAFAGLIAVAHLERNMRWHLLASILVLVGGWWLQVDRSEWLWLILAIFLVIQSELANTVVENVVDLLTDQHYALAAKYAKDMAAAAVLVAAIFAIVVGLIIFLPKLLWLI